ncbi:MAG: hypothetical protein U5R14_04090 [Gemmatimonadota bacterium]|nr:hypothetical protein [Gemmatimonadota bacterium]
MEHLTTETLARLVDDVPDREERAHLEDCPLCASELEALGEQTRALGSLPEILPPRDDWSVLEARLRSEGLLHDPGLLSRIGLARTPTWMRFAAALLLFASGVASGAGWANRGSGDAEAGVLTEASNLDDAAAAVESAERNYVEAMSQYRELLAQSGSEVESVDPISRYAALEHLVLVSQAAVRQAPGDPFLNGFLASARAERDAAARLVSTGSGGWF